MSIELGHFALILAFAIAAVSAVAGLCVLAARRADLPWSCGKAAVLQFLLVGGRVRGADPGLRHLRLLAARWPSSIRTRCSR